MRSRVPEAHQQVTSGTHQVVPFLDNLAFLAVIQAILVEPLPKMLRDLQPACLHPIEHLHHTGFDTEATLCKLRMLVQHLDAQFPVRISNRLP